MLEQIKLYIYIYIHKQKPLLSQLPPDHQSYLYITLITYDIFMSHGFHGRASSKVCLFMC
jgi:hypothetical protein